MGGIESHGTFMVGIRPGTSPHNITIWSCPGRTGGVHCSPTFRGRTAVSEFRLKGGTLVLAAMVCVCACLGVADDQALTKDQIKQFLLTAKVVNSKQTGKGVTSPWRLTLSDGTITHDASFQPVDEHKSSVTLASGKTQLNFVDSYKYNIAAYNLGGL